MSSGVAEIEHIDLTALFTYRTMNVTDAQSVSRKYLKLSDIITPSYPMLLIIICRLVHSRSYIVVLSLVTVSHSLCFVSLLPAVVNLCFYFFVFSPALVLPFYSINYDDEIGSISASISYDVVRIGRHRPVSFCRPMSSDIVRQGSSAVVRCRAQCEHRFSYCKKKKGAIFETQCINRFAVKISF